MAKNAKPRKPYQLKLPDHEKAAVVAAYRSGAMKAIRSLRSGSIDEIELDKLQNFVVTACAMMELVSLSTFREAQRIAEMRSLIHNATEEAVVMDPRKLAITGLVNKAEQALADPEIVAELEETERRHAAKAN